MAVHENMDTAPKTKIILLWLPEFDMFASCWWVGNWSWVHDRWQLKTPFSMDGKQVFVKDAPEPTGWHSLPMDLN